MNNTRVRQGDLGYLGFRKRTTDTSWSYTAKFGTISTIQNWWAGSFFDQSKWFIHHNGNIDKITFIGATPRHGPHVINTGYNSRQDWILGEILNHDDADTGIGFGTKTPIFSDTNTDTFDDYLIYNDEFRFQDILYARSDKLQLGAVVNGFALRNVVGSQSVSPDWIGKLNMVRGTTAAVSFDDGLGHDGDEVWMISGTNSPLGTTNPQITARSWAIFTNNISSFPSSQTQESIRLDYNKIYVYKKLSGSWFRISEMTAPSRTS